MELRRESNPNQGEGKVCLNHTPRLQLFVISEEPLIHIMTSKGNTLH
jgi:hypothetical protein